MNKKEHMVPLGKLNLTNRFLFDQVMEDTRTQQDVLSIILEREVNLLPQGQTEKEWRVSSLAKSIRMDVFSVDEDQTVYNTEMQSAWKTDLAKRSRYYQSLLDASLLEPGAPTYHLLNDSYLIIIMTFDLFGLKKYRYTFRPRCEEAQECRLEDGTTRIFLSTKGTNEDEVSSELAAFLRYVENTSDQTARAVESQRIRRIHDRVCRVRASEEIGVKYMQAWEEKYYDRQEAREEGIAEGERKKLKDMVKKKISKGKNCREIAEDLEEEEKTIKELIEELEADCPREESDTDGRREQRA